MDARPTPLDRRRSARAAAERRSGLEQRGGQRASRIAVAAAELQGVVSFHLGFRGSPTELSYRLQIALQVLAPRSAASPMSHR
jgi:hypothetical protein